MLPGVVHSPTDTAVERKDCESESVQADGYPAPPISNCCVNLANSAGCGNGRNPGSVDARRVARCLLPVLLIGGRGRGGIERKLMQMQKNEGTKRRGNPTGSGIGSGIAEGWVGGGGEEGRKEPGDCFLARSPALSLTGVPNEFDVEKRNLGRGLFLKPETADLR